MMGTTPGSQSSPAANGRLSMAAITIGLAIGGPLVGLVIFLPSQRLAGEAIGVLAAVTLLTLIASGPLSYCAIRRLRPGTPRWKAGVGAALSATWSVGFWLGGLAAFALLFSGSESSLP